jgi:hypothetical protein
MAKRNEPPRDDEPTSGRGDASNPDSSASDAIKRIPAPRLVPAQDEANERIYPLSPDVVSVRFEEAAKEAGHDDEPAAEPSETYLRAKRFLPLAAAIAIAAGVGAAAGALTTSGLSRFSDDKATAAIQQDSRALKDAMAKVGTDLAALKSNVESSARNSTQQMARLSERLERTDRAQTEAAGKVAKLADTLEKRNTQTAAHAADPVTTGTIPTASSPPPVPAAPATRPASPPIVDGWVLRSVQNGTALIQGRIGLVEVQPGDSLPALGRIETIRRQDNQWVVVTSRGLIVSR